MENETVRAVGPLISLPLLRGLLAAMKIKQTVLAREANYKYVGFNALMQRDTLVASRYEGLLQACERLGIERSWIIIPGLAPTGPSPDLLDVLRRATHTDTGARPVGADVLEVEPGEAWVEGKRILAHG
jgi:hypothetical protein